MVVTSILQQLLLTTVGSDGRKVKSLSMEVQNLGQLWARAAVTTAPSEDICSFRFKSLKHSIQLNRRQLLFIGWSITVQYFQKLLWLLYVCNLLMLWTKSDMSCLRRVICWLVVVFEFGAEGRSFFSFNKNSVMFPYITYTSRHNWNTHLAI